MSDCPTGPTNFDSTGEGIQREMRRDRGQCGWEGEERREEGRKLGKIGREGRQSESHQTHPGNTLGL